MVSPVQSIVRSAVPGLMRTLSDLKSSFRARRHTRCTFWDRQKIAAEAFFPDAKVRIMSGPFAGMAYVNEVAFGPIEPKWIGTYEDELHTVIEEVVNGGYDVILDVGAAEGYYSCGLAYRCPQSRVYSFETDPWSRAQQRRIAKLNSLTNLHVGRRCSWDVLGRFANFKTFLLMDIEGGELDLLDPEACEALRRFDILVEVHETPGSSHQENAARLTQRFQATHKIARFVAQPKSVAKVAVRLPNQFPSLKDFLDEHRHPEQVWLWMRGKA